MEVDRPQPTKKHKNYHTVIEYNKLKLIMSVTINVCRLHKINIT